jgi:hypothetical protein
MGAFSRSPECMEGEFCEGSHAEDSTKPWSEHFPTEVGVEALVKDVRVKGERLIVGEGELHAAHDGVQPLGLGPPVLLVHQVCVVDYPGDLMEHPVLQLVVLQESLKGAILPSVGEPGPDHVEEFRPLRGLRGIAEEGKGGLRVYKTTIAITTGWIP